MNSFEVIQLARKHVNNGAPMQSSAQRCLNDAEALQAQHKYVHACNLAVKSLQYSVGVLHPDYQAADPRLPRALSGTAGGYKWGE